MPHVTPRLPARPIVLIGVVALLLAGAVTLRAIITDMALLESMHAAVGEHLDQAELMALVQSGQNDAAFDEAFEHGDELFETEFNALDGVGANVGDGERSRACPRGSTGPAVGHVTAVRATGPNARVAAMPVTSSCSTTAPGSDGRQRASAIRSTSATCSSSSSATRRTSSRPGPCSAWPRR